MQIKPVDDRLLIEEEEENSEFAVPEGSQREKYRIGVILDIGEKVDVGLTII